MLISTETAYHLKSKNIFHEPVKENSFEFWNLEKKINSNNLIYQYKNEGRSPKDFRYYQNPIDSLKSLRDGNVNPR